MLNKHSFISFVDALLVEAGHYQGPHRKQGPDRNHDLTDLNNINLSLNSSWKEHLTSEEDH